MSTNSFIAYKENNQITAIYCHWDGYLEYNGLLLQTLYEDAERAKKLVELGDISGLSGKISSDEPDLEIRESYPDIIKKYINQVTTAYHRDRQEDWGQVQPRKFDSVQEYIDFIKDYGWIEFMYLFNADNDDTAPYNTWSYIIPGENTKFERINITEILKGES